VFRSGEELRQSLETTGRIADEPIPEKRAR